MFVRVTAGQRSMEFDCKGGDCVSFDFSRGIVDISADYWCEYSDLVRQTAIMLTEDECLEIVAGALKEGWLAVDSLCEDDRVLNAFIGYVSDRKERINSVMYERTFDLLERYQDKILEEYVENQNKREKEIERLTKRVAELEATIKNVKEALGVPYLAVV